MRVASTPMAAATATTAASVDKCVTAIDDESRDGLHDGGKRRGVQPHDDDTMRTSLVVVFVVAARY